MPFSLFHEHFPDVAAQEGRSLTLRDDPDIPDGHYALVEMFCDERGCDCRRVLLHVWDLDAPKGRSGSLATISFGWESADFYQRWMGGPMSDDELENLMGPALQWLAPQSELAPALLRRVVDLALDDEYVARLQRHYAMYRARIDAPRASTRRPGPKVGRNDPCPCGSGKKHKKCCGAAGA